jgi:signal peptide peptidase SppA
MPTEMTEDRMLPLAARMIGEPLLVDPGHVDLFRSCVAYVAQHELAQDHAFASDDRDFWGSDPNPYRPYVVKDGILHIPVQGVLLNRFPYALGRWATGYDYIERAIQRGLRDPAVKGICLVVDSPGGEVAGCFELTDKIFGWRREKPMRAFAVGGAYSAAYSLASAAVNLTVARSAGTGSVGVMTMHVAFPGALDQMGVVVTLIYAGRHKVDGNPYQSLPESVRDRIQARVNKTYGVFVSTVARNRGMDENEVRKTEALAYDAEDSVRVGFADRIGAYEDEPAQFQRMIEMETETMTQNAAPEAMFTAEEVDAARERGRTSERARITAILESEEAKNRPTAAMAVALTTDMPVDTAKVFLGKMPTEVKAPGARASGDNVTPFDRAMNSTPNPAVGAEVTDPQAEDANSDSVLSARLKLAGRRSAGLPIRK